MSDDDTLGARTTFFGDGRGGWLQVTRHPRCLFGSDEGSLDNALLNGCRCQGTAGHRDVHWAYAPDGSFRWVDNDDDPRHGGCSGSTPPGHKDYPDPVEKCKEHWMEFCDEEAVADPELVAALEDDFLGMYEALGRLGFSGASVNRPRSPG